ncbi:MAG: PBP1A family penicillin-binding protein [Nitrospirae bacterium]|nr:PBP1A family penicillin-binding protein [Nitrospirota bacterium]MBI3352704.1 PBP1A family penicillin-binding protein [Nitrospirota bacterium]
MPYNGQHNKDKLTPSLNQIPLKNRWDKKKIALAILIFCAIFILSGVGFIWDIVRDLPSIEGLKTYEPSTSTRVYGENKALIGQFATERRILVPLVKIPKYLFQAIIAVEDSRFLEHGGFDYWRTLKAVLNDIKSLRLKEGGSTITQQLARSLFLSPEKHLKRKIKELILATKIESVLSKDEILELYLNQIYLGHGSYGVQAASKLYFGKDVSDLTLAESAFLAGLPKAPSEYSPFVNPEKAKQRQGVVLRRMVSAGFISEAQYQEAFKQNLVFQKLQKEDEVSPYFMEHIRQHLISKYGEEAVYRGGLIVNTSLNLEMQTFATEAIKSGLRAIDKRQGYRGAAGHTDVVENVKPRNAFFLQVNPFGKDEIFDGVVIDVTESFARVQAKGIIGKIKLEDMAWAKKRLNGKDLKNDVQYLEKATAKQILNKGDMIKLGLKKFDPGAREYSFTLEQNPLVEGALVALDPATGGIKAMVGGYDFKRSEFNRALLAKRQPGSAFKPIIYATALEKGKSPSDIIIDSPVIYKDAELDKIWKPENYEGKFYGPISLREALAHSRNLATIKLLEEVGISPVIEFGQRVGISSPFQHDLSLALGTSSLGLLELSSAYSVFANQGTLNEPYSIESVTDQHGKVLETHENHPREVVSKEVSYMITNMLEDVIQKGTAVRARELGRHIAGKTGTTNDFGDAWFIGYTPKLVTGVWVGFDDRRSLGDREAAASVALPVWISFMKQAFNLIPDVPFSIPENIVYAKIDSGTGLLSDENSENTTTEPFIKGFQPTTPSKKRSSSYTEFYNIDN